jgi:hypothetical protein
MSTDTTGPVCGMCHGPNPTTDPICSRDCEIDLAFANGRITDYPEETTVPDTHEYKTADGRTVGLYDHVYIEHSGYCRAEITDTRIDETGALLLIECEDGPNWVYEDEIWAEEPTQ